MVMPHLEISHMYLKVNGGKVIIVATHEKVPTSKSYMDPTWILMWKGEVSQSYLLANLPTSKSTKLKYFFKKC
jgi:hypothetical protein